MWSGALLKHCCVDATEINENVNIFVNLMARYQESDMCLHRQVNNKWIPRFFDTHNPLTCEMNNFPFTAASQQGEINNLKKYGQIPCFHATLVISVWRCGRAGAPSFLNWATVPQNARACQWLVRRAGWYWPFIVQSVCAQAVEKQWGSMNESTMHWFVLECFGFPA